MWLFKVENSLKISLSLYLFFSVLGKAKKFAYIQKLWIISGEENYILFY